MTATQLAPATLLGSAGAKLDPPLLAQASLRLVIIYVVLNRLIEDIYTLPVGASIFVTDIVLAMLLVTWALWMLSEPRPFPQGLAGILGSVLMVLVLVAPYLNAGSLTEFEASGAERGLVRGTLYAGLFLATYHLASWREWATRITKVLVAMSVFQALLAIYEAMTGAPLQILGAVWQAVGLEVDPRGMRGDNPMLQARLTGELRAQATAPHPLVLAGVLVTGIGICVVRYLHSDSPKQRRRYLAAIVVQLVGVAATNERTGFVALAALGLLLVITQLPKLPSALSLLFTLVLGGAVISVVSPQTPRLILDFFTGQTTDHNVTVRTARYAMVPELLNHRPIIGPGFTTSDPSVMIFDNAYLTQLIELGVLGLVVLLGFLLVVSGRPFAMYTRAVGEDQILLLGAMCAAVTLFVTMATFDVLSFDQLFPSTLMLLAIGLARTDALRRTARGDRSELALPTG